MTRKLLIRCVDCDALFMVSPADQSPEYCMDEGEWKALPRDDRASFEWAHRGHRLEELHVIEGTLISHEDYIEPLRTSYFEATNGKERFVVRKSRKNVNDPQRYELIPGRLRFKTADLKIDDTAIQRELERKFRPLQLSPEKIRRFVQQLGRVVSRLKPEELRRVPFERHNPSVWYFYIDQRALKNVFASSSEFLDKREVKQLEAFIQKHLEDDLFMIVAKIHFDLEQNAEETRAIIANA